MKHLMICLILIMSSGSYWYISFIRNTCTCTRFVVLDVGQGTGIYIQTREGKEILIDTGETFKTLRELARLRNPLDRHIDMVALTHADRDHIGLMPEIIHRYEIGNIVLSEREETDVISLAIQESHAHIIETTAGDIWNVDEIQFQVLWPGIVGEGSKNDESLVLLVTIGTTNILIPGDITRRVEQALVDLYQTALPADILIIPHHGSDSSSSYEFLEAVDPAVGIISAGENNRYGHPHVNVMSRLQEQSIQIFNTAHGETFEFRIFEDDFDIIKR